MLEAFLSLDKLLQDASTALELVTESEDQELLTEAQDLCEELEKQVRQLEFLCKMNGPHDHCDAILEINGGSGGTDAQDWAEMLFRMYSRWTEAREFKIETLDHAPGEEAGIKNVILLIKGRHAFGYLRPEQGVHRLVRISPFDSNARRHTSFASVAVTPDIEEEIEIDIEEKDLRIDTFRASGAGGQHVNKTDSAVRITHLPSGIAVACQSERSQHKNKSHAMKILKAKLYELEQQEQRKKMDQLKGDKKAIDYGSQIRSYVMHPYKMVKDHRTNFETGNVDQVLDGEIDPLIEAYLLSDFNKS